MELTTTKKIKIHSRLFDLNVEIDISNLINKEIISYDLQFEGYLMQRIFEKLALTTFNLQHNFTVYKIIIAKSIEEEELINYVDKKCYIVLTESFIHIPTSLNDKLEDTIRDIAKLIENHLDMNLITDDNLKLDSIYKVDGCFDSYQYVGNIGNDHIFRILHSDKCVIHNCLSGFRKF